MSKVLPLNLDRQIAYTELLVEYSREEAERYRHWHDAAPDSPNGMIFALYRELAEERAAHAKRLRAQLAARRQRDSAALPLEPSAECAPCPRA